MDPYEALHLLLQLIVLLVCAHAGGRCAARLKIPRVAGELAAGLLLGPTFLGATAPQVQAWVFAPESFATALRVTLAKPALGIFLFAAGLETPLPFTWAEGKRVLIVSLLGLGVPFIISWTVASAAPALFGADGLRPWFPLFLGTVLSISALPVIARLFMDLHLEHSALAGTVLCAAAIDDLVGWGLFVLLLSKAGTGRAFSSWQGFHSLFSAFLAGVFCRTLRFTKPAKALKVAALTLFAPLYFAGIGLQIHLRRDFSPLLAALLLAVACVGKILGASAGARLAGWPWRNAWAVGWAMNARGAMEIILASVALDQGIIGASFHTGLVFVALATSLMAAPCLRLYAAELAEAGLN